MSFQPYILYKEHLAIVTVLVLTTVWSGWTKVTVMMSIKLVLTTV